MKVPLPPDDPPDLQDSPLYWLAVLAAARRSGDRLLERYARAHLGRLGVKVVFIDNAASPDQAEQAEP
ncbi:MAG: hypothetical protein RMJ88_16790 [Thermogemmata sp.]|nr:hypothetical protein [Thermogemmata sp.]